MAERDDRSGDQTGDRTGRGPDPGRGRPDLHDPTAGFGGAPPARSALTLRLVLAAFGLVFAVGAAVLGFVAGWPVLGWVMIVVAVVALADLGWVGYRKWRGEPG